MIKAVLFDLDDTLLDINFTAFMTRRSFAVALV
jgi:FMN phosphatase YigB (HAD superfamily)